MLVVISPAKTLDFESESLTNRHSNPLFPSKSEILIAKLRTLSRKKIADLMSVSKDLAQLNFERYLSFGSAMSRKNLKQAVFAFKGDVYLGLDADSFSEEDLDYAQNHLRILSGLYGLLRPLDLIEPYRLEMGTQLPVRRSKNLYQFWGNLLTETLNKHLIDAQNPAATGLAATDIYQGQPLLINLASVEYWKAVNPDKLQARVITPSFLDWKNGQYKFVSFFGKKARGAMARYLIQNRWQNPESLKNFEWEGYALNAELSEGDNWVFTRRQES